MSGSIIRECYFWFASVAAGAGMAFTYDLLRLLRRFIRHGRLAVDLEDILYWTACFIISFTLLYYGNNGVIRFAAVFGAAVGMSIYEFTLGRIFLKFGFWIIEKVIIKFLLTLASFRNRIILQHSKKRKIREEDGRHVRTESKFKKKKTKNAGISSYQK